MMKQILIVLLLLIFISCSRSNLHSKQENNQDVYDFHIMYSHMGVQMDSSDWRLKQLNPNNLYIFLESYFKNDTIYIKDDKHVIVDNLVVTTEPSQGVAESFIVENIADINHLTLKVNSSPKVSFEIARKDFFIIGIRRGIREHKKEITVVFYKKAPVYY